ncbi:MAG: hypothetical protein IJ161_08385 [Bacteroidales bacterium]|nr:hypothetical protein [Bacteroidales bacterium]
MKFTINTGVLLQALELLKRIVPTRATMPIYEDIHVKASENGTLTLTGSDTEHSLIIIVQADTVEKEGSCCIDHKILTSLLKEMPELPLAFELKGNTNSPILLIEWFGGHTEMPVFDANDYPKIARISEETKSITKAPFPSGHVSASPRCLTPAPSAKHFRTASTTRPANSTAKKGPSRSSTASDSCMAPGEDSPSFPNVIHSS